MRRLLMVVGLALLAGGVQAAEPDRYREDARALEALVNAQYAYPERLPGGRMPISDKLRTEAERVSDKRSLLRYAERALLTLADHHAITGSSFPDSWALVPSYSDLWIEKHRRAFVVEAVREDSPAERAGVRAGDELLAVGDALTAQAVEAFWADLGLASTEDRAGFAARMLAAGRRDRPRVVSIRDRSGKVRRLILSSLYAGAVQRPPISYSRYGGELRIKFHDSLGRDDTIAAFDAAMAQAAPQQRVILDLTDTPSGGNTVVARAIMGWFVSKPAAYQVHNLPAEQRRTGIARQWAEQVLPREGKHHPGPVVVRVGRWTGSMGEGLAIGFHAIGARVVGDRMAGLLGAVYDHKLGDSGLVIKIPTERLMTVDGVGREHFTPSPPRRGDPAASRPGS